MTEGLSLGESALAFVVLVVPGFLYVRGYFRGRARLVPEQPLYLLAQAIVSSLLIIAAAWWLGGRHLAHWAGAGTLIAGHHEAYTFRILLIMLVVPFPAGLITGGIVEWCIDRLMNVSRTFKARRQTHERAFAAASEMADAAERTKTLDAAEKIRPPRWTGSAQWLLAALEQRELLDTANGWTKTWRSINRELQSRGDGAFVYVRVRTRDGNDITGAFGDRSCR